MTPLWGDKGEWGGTKPFLWGGGLVDFFIFLITLFFLYFL